MPDPLPKPPGRPPGDPIIIRDPARTPDAPEIDRPPDKEEDEEDAEIRRPPANIPEMPPPPGLGEPGAVSSHVLRRGRLSARPAGVQA